MPIIKVYGYECANEVPIRSALAKGMEELFGKDGSAIVFVCSICEVCDEEHERYRYVEILYSGKDQLNKIMSLLERLKITDNMDVISFQLPPGCYRPAGT